MSVHGIADCGGGAGGGKGAGGMVAGGEGRTAAHLLGLKAAAAMTAEGVTFPVDLVKTRLQLQQGARAPGALSMVRAVWNSGGPLAFYKGATPAIVRHIPYSTTRIAVYEVLREYTLGGQPAGGAGGELSLGSRLFFGATAGAVGQLIAVPADVVKVKMQGDTAGKYKGFVDASVKTFREAGVAGLWRGSGPAVNRAALANLGELTGYDTAKRGLLNAGMKDTFSTHVACAAFSGLCATTCSCPADVVKSRMMNMPRGDGGELLYRNSLDCLTKTVRGEGFMALYKGFFPTWMRMGPWQLVFWVSYEQLRHLSGFGGF